MGAVAELERPTISSETELIQQAAAGDSEAFGELYRLHARAIQGQVHRWTETPDAPDLVQDTFTQALGKISTFEDRGEGMRPWLSTIARNRIVSHYRKTSWEDVNSRTVDQKLAEQKSEPFEDRVFGREIGRQALQTVMECLSPGQRQLFRDIFFSSMSYEDYAELNDTTVGATRARVHRARVRIRKVLEVETVDDLLESY